MLNVMQLMRLFDSFYNKSDHNMGISISIAQHDKIVSSQNYGFRNPSLKQNVDENTIFNIGSVSKIFTVLAVLILVDMKKLHLDDKVADYLSFFSMKDVRYKDITVRTLLNHSSGLYGSTFNGGVGYSFHDVRKNFIEELKKSYLQFAPTEMAVYCDDGFFLAQILVEITAEMTYMEFLKKYVFDKIGLVRTGKSLGERSADDNIAFPLNSQSSSLLETISMYGVAGLSSSSQDLCKLGINLMKEKNRIISHKTYEELFKTQLSSFFIKAEEKFGFGLGWDFVGKYFGNSFLLKRGKTSEYSSLFMLIPDLSISINILSSRVTEEIKLIENRILNVLFEKKCTQNVAHIHFPTKSIIKKQKSNLYVNRLDLWNFEFLEKDSLLCAEAKLLKIKKYFSYNQKYKIFFDEDENQYFFKEINNDIYFCKFNDVYKTFLPVFKNTILNNFSPENLEIANKFNNKLWRHRKPYNYEIPYTKNSLHMVKPNEIKSACYNIGSLFFFDGVKKIISRNRAVPISFAPGQSDVQLFWKNNEIIYIKFGGMKYLPDT